MGCAASLSLVPAAFGDEAFRRSDLKMPAQRALPGEFKQEFVTGEQVAGLSVARDFEKFLIVMVATYWQIERRDGGRRGQKSEAGAVVGQKPCAGLGPQCKTRTGKHVVQFRQRIFAARQKNSPPGDGEREGGEVRIVEMPERQHRVGVEDEGRSGDHAPLTAGT